MSLAHFQLTQIIVLGGLALGIFYFTAYDDGTVLHQSIENIQNQVKKVEGDVAKVKEDIERVKLFKKEVSNNKKVIKFFLNYIPSSLTFTEISSLVNKQALSSGVNIESKEDSQYKDQEENTEYDVLNLKLKVSGSFAQIMFFLSKLTAQKRLLIVNKIKLNVASANKQVMSDINLLAYRYKESVEEPSVEQKPGQ